MSIFKKLIAHMLKLNFSVFFYHNFFSSKDKIFLFLRLQDLFILLFVSINFYLLNKLEIKFLLITLLILFFTNITGYIVFVIFIMKK